MKTHPQERNEYYEITNEEFMAMATALGLPTSGEMSKFFGVRSRVARNWIDGDRPIPIPIIMVLELMRRFNLTPEQVLEITEAERK
jgi:hypothetical protein